MKRVMSYRLPVVDAGIAAYPIFNWTLSTARTLQLSAGYYDNQYRGIIIPFHLEDGRLYQQSSDDWTIDLDYTGNDRLARRSGLGDGLALTESSYAIFALFDQNYTHQGYTVHHLPLSSYSTTTTYNKGNTCTLSGITKPYRFTIGARVRVVRTSGTAPQYTNAEWNLGTIIDIASGELVVSLDNNANYGTSFSASGAGEFIRQLDCYQPYIPDDIDQELIYPYYRIVGFIETDSSNNIFYVYKAGNNTYRRPTNQYILNATGLTGNQNVALSGATHIYKHIPPTAAAVTLNLKAVTNTGSDSLLYVNAASARSAYMALTGYTPTSSSGLWNSATITLRADGLLYWNTVQSGSSDYAIQYVGYMNERGLYGIG